MLAFLKFSDHGTDEGAEPQSSMSDWDVAVRFHDLRSRIKHSTVRRKITEISVRGILNRAQNILGSMIHSRGSAVGEYGALPPSAEGAELDLEATLENSNPTNLKPWMCFSFRRIEPVVLCVDTSLSMTGEKLALTAVAMAVVLLQFPDDPVGIVTFETEAHVVKTPAERITVQELVARFLETPGKGYTDMEEGLRAALQQVGAIRDLRVHRPASAVLISDGKYTAGKDPSYLAARFPHLQVIKIGSDQSSFGLCLELARKGRGSLRQVQDMKDLPWAMFSAVKDLIRGRYY